MGKIFEGWFTLTHTYLTSSELTALPLPVLLRYCKVHAAAVQICQE